jgi:hypothetical protein
MRVAHRGVPPHPLPGIEQPVASPREVEMSTFFDDLANAFGLGDNQGDSGKPDQSDRSDD